MALPSLIFLGTSLGRFINLKFHLPQETPSGGRKKIIPVGSDFESSPSPETPGSPVTPSPAKGTSHEEEEDSQKKKSKFGLKWKSKSGQFFSPFLNRSDHCAKFDSSSF